MNASVPGEGYFAILRFYSPTEAAINKAGRQATSMHKDATP
jgi:hypothetical protein